MEDWGADWDRGALERIVALLFSLANLADLAAGASFFRRRRVLGILNYAEVEARSFVIGMVSGAQVPADALEPADDAERLAVRLRALALMLCVLLARGFALPGAAGPRTCLPSHGMAGLAAPWRDAPTPPTPDTS